MSQAVYRSHIVAREDNFQFCVEDMVYMQQCKLLFKIEHALINAKKYMMQMGWGYWIAGVYYLGNGVLLH